MEPRNHQAKLSKRVHKRLYGIIAGLVLVLAVSMAGTFASSLVAIESAKDTVISSDGAFVDKKTGALVSTENPHITTKVFNLVQALEGLLSSETNAALPGQKGIVARERHLGAWCTPCIVAHFCDGLGRPTSEIKNAASRVTPFNVPADGCFCGMPQQPPPLWCGHLRRVLPSGRRRGEGCQVDPVKQCDHRDKRSARQPQGRIDRRRAPNQRPRLAAQRVRDAMQPESIPSSPAQYTVTGVTDPRPQPWPRSPTQPLHPSTTVPAHALTRLWPMTTPLPPPLTGLVNQSRLMQPSM